MSELQRGSERKFTLKMKPIDGVRLGDCTLKVELMANGKSIMLDESNLVKDDEDTYKILLCKEDAEALGSNNIKARVYIGIPDKDFPDGYRDQIYLV
jgi:hypothetical protein